MLIEHRFTDERKDGLESLKRTKREQIQTLESIIARVKKSFRSLSNKPLKLLSILNFKTYCSDFLPSSQDLEFYSEK